MALRRRLVELGDATHMKSANNTMQVKFITDKKCSFLNAQYVIII